MKYMRGLFLSRIVRHGAIAALLSIISFNTHAGVLPEDRSDLLYHVYDGGGVTVQGPSLLVRKKLGESIDLNATYDIDMVSSASVDVMSSASPYKEHRTQWSSGAEYLRGKTTYSASYLNSTEPDYISDNASFSISEDMFGDLTTVTLGFSRGWDDVKRHEKTTGTYTDMGRMDRRNYRVGLSQILTKRLIVSLNYESIAQEGYQQNPYRKARFCNDSTCIATTNEDELYPLTRASNAISIDGRYYLPYRASIKAGYRYYTDTWGIHSHTGELEYVHPIHTRWIIETSVRYYTQTHADFYSDLFPYENSQNFLARDKELATFSDIALHLGLNWKIPIHAKLIGTLSGFYDRIEYSYADFRNNAPPYRDLAPSQQPLFSYGANVYQLQFSLQY